MALQMAKSGLGASQAAGEAFGHVRDLARRRRSNCGSTDPGEWVHGHGPDAALGYFARKSSYCYCASHYILVTLASSLRPHDLVEFSLQRF